VPRVADGHVLPAHRDPPRIFSAPLSPAEALANIEALAGLPRVRLLAEEDGFSRSTVRLPAPSRFEATSFRTPTWRRCSSQHGVRSCTRATRTCASRVSRRADPFGREPDPSSARDEATLPGRPPYDTLET